MVQGSLYFSVRGRFTDDLLFLLLAGPFVINVEPVDLDIVFEAVGSVAKVVDMADVLEKLIDELDLLAFSHEIKP
jgi:hypothetical protein